jgi:hypothetical protein
MAAMMRASIHTHSLSYTYTHVHTHTHLREDTPLLVVLAAEHRHVRLCDIEQLGNHRGYPSEEDGPRHTAQRLLQLLHLSARTRARGTLRSPPPAAR